MVSTDPSQQDALDLLASPRPLCWILCIFPVLARALRGYSAAHPGPNMTVRLIGESKLAISVNGVRVFLFFWSGAGSQPQSGFLSEVTDEYKNKRGSDIRNMKYRVQMKAAGVAV